MREKSERLFYNVDWFLVVIYFLLVGIGWMNIYSAVYDTEKSDVFNFSRLESKQMLFAIIAIVIAVAILVVDASFFTATAFFFYSGVIVLNLIVAFAGADIKGSHSWFKFGSFSFQPGEFAKWATALALAKYLSGRAKTELLKDTVVSFGLIFLPVLIMIVLQRETGVALVFGALVMLLYREGLIAGWLLLVGFVSIVAMVVGMKYPLVWPFVSISVLAILAINFAFMRKRTWKSAFIRIAIVAYVGGIMIVSGNIIEKLPEHQTARIKVWLGLPVSQKMLDRYDYNTRQSLIAIGSGGATGKGYLDGTQTKFRFVPEQETDFIFCTVGEEWGFMGTTFVVLLYTLLIIRLITQAERQRSDFTRIYGYAVASIFLFHLLVNVGMTIGLLPVIGIPLPFFSYGGSSLISFTILLFIFIKLDSQRLLILR
jgi:rod shape determining protein RodA